MGHSVSKAADNAVKKSQSTKDAAVTTEQRIAAIRRNLEAKLAVPPDEQRFLLQQYDAAISHV